MPKRSYFRILGRNKVLIHVAYEIDRPEIPLLPKEPHLRAKVRQIVETIAGDIQPGTLFFDSLKSSPKSESDEKGSRSTRKATRMG